MASDREAGGGNMKFETGMCKLCHFLQMRNSGWGEETDRAHKVSEFLTRMERKYRYVGTTVRQSSSHCPESSQCLTSAILESGARHLL
jgi:hypothetical protein